MPPLSFRFSILNQVYEPFLSPITPLSGLSKPETVLSPGFSCLQTSEKKTSAQIIKLTFWTEVATATPLSGLFILKFSFKAQGFRFFKLQRNKPSTKLIIPTFWTEVATATPLSGLSIPKFSFKPKVFVSSDFREINHLLR